MFQGLNIAFWLREWCRLGFRVSLAMVAADLFDHAFDYFFLQWLNNNASNLFEKLGGRSGVVLCPALGQLLLDGLLV